MPTAVYISEHQTPASTSVISNSPASNSGHERHKICMPFDTTWGKCCNTDWRRDIPIQAYGEKNNK